MNIREIQERLNKHRARTSMPCEDKERYWCWCQDVEYLLIKLLYLECGIDIDTETCVWENKVRCEGKCGYSTTCNNSFIFEEGTLKDNKFKFCPWCGCEIEIII